MTLIVVKTKDLNETITLPANHDSDHIAGTAVESLARFGYPLKTGFLQFGHQNWITIE
jgi:hypothetical protein